jgi:ABC-type cobalamin/Fe3+-siderophores transport system ATPase subunit
MYNGMKWLKCDLQMQTPGDSYNWLRTCSAYIGKEYTDEQLNNSVDLYLKRCHDQGLQVIGVTDHNFIGKDYLQRLIERNNFISHELEKDPLIIFPGFEVEISQGLGVHLLCLFNTDTPLEHIDELVTELGLPTRNRIIHNAVTPLEKDFNSLISFIQNHKDYPGVVIAAHPLAESGMLNDNFMSDHFQKAMFTDSRLLAMEIPKPVDKLARGIQKIILSTDDCHAPWKRNKAIATIMSSDCYSLEESEKGYIGKRHTWIQFSNMTLESLKQAFNDHDSRILHSEKIPDNQYGRIKSLEISDVSFLANQKVDFSPNLTCIIGGRGSGKSSLLEYIRLCTNSSSKFDEQLKRIKNTLTESSTLSVIWEDTNGLIDEFKYSSGEVLIPSRTDIVDVSVIFKSLGISIFSQREITQMAQDSPSLLPLIDKIAGPELRDEQKNEVDVRDEIVSLIQDQIKYNRLKSEKTELDQELVELKRKWDAFTSVKEHNEMKNKVKSSKTSINTMFEDKLEIKKKLNDIKADLEELKTKHESINLDNLINPAYLKQIQSEFVEGLSELDIYLQEAYNTFENKLNAATINHKDWHDLKSEFERNEKEFEDACKAQGISHQEFELLKDIDSQIQGKEEQITNKENDMLTTLEKTSKIGDLHDSLADIWKKQHTVRQAKVDSLVSLDSIPRVRIESELIPFLKIDIIYMGDEENFKEIWGKFPNNGRTRLGRNWEYIGECIFDAFQIAEEAVSPWTILEKWLEDESQVPDELTNLYTELKSHFVDNFETWEQYKTKRIKDAINITLYRSDGSKAGSLLDNGLSDGQKNTAILTLLFSQGNGPIIIDQPEDELDSDFIYNELVPIIRKMKNKRQIIIVSHNANLPVNGDAELVYALKTNEGKGILRTDGGLDNPSVKEAILDIMEGSEEAFKRRSEKYSG